MIIYQSAERIWKNEMGSMRLRLCDRRCLCGPPLLRPCHYQPCAGISRLPGGNHPAAGLEKSGEHPDFLGEPRLAFLISAGNMDSMVNHYSVSKKRRAKDSYTPGGEMGKRPDYATVVYGNLIRSVYKKTPIVIGGIEASLRRLAHYDYWSGRLKRSILLDSQADLISYGMGERSIVEIADALNSGIDVKDITFIDGTVYKAENLDSVYDELRLPSYQSMKEDKREYAKSFYTQYCNTDPFVGKRLVEPYSDHLYVVQNPAAKPLSQSEMDQVYSLPYMRTYHPSYEKERGRACYSGNPVFPCQQQGLFWRLQFLRPDLSSGKNPADKKP